MACIAIMIGTKGPDPAYQDGDSVDVFNNRRTLIDRAQTIIRPANKQELRGYSPEGLLRKYLQATYEFEFEHISKNLIQKKTLATGAIEKMTYPTFDVKLGNFEEKRYVKLIDMHDVVFRYLFDVKADVAGFKAVRDGPAVYIQGPDGKYANYKTTLVNREYSHVSTEVINKFKSKLPMFVSDGKEIWYGGKEDYSMTVVNKVWDAIENDNPALKRADNIYWNFSPAEKASFLCIPIIDIDDAKLEEFKEPKWDKNDPDKLVMLKKRNHGCVIDDLVLEKTNITDIRNLTKQVDILVNEPDIDSSTIIRTKV